MAQKKENEAPDFDDPPRTPHKCHAYQLMEHAEAMLEEGGRLQASEKAYGAYRHQLKALAEEQGWEDNKNTQPELRRRVAELAQKKLGIKEKQMQLLMIAPVDLHTNFYKDTRSLDEIRYGIKFTKELIGIMRRLGGDGNSASSGNGNDTPSGNGNDTPSGSGNDGEGGSSQPPQSARHKDGTASMGTSHRTPQMRQAKKLKGQFREQLVEEPSVPLVGPDDFPSMTQAEFDALKDF